VVYIWRSKNLRVSSIKLLGYVSTG
jgi:hypothetical protein